MKIIGIAGGSASGKSTLAFRLTEALSQYRVRLFAMDSYYKPESALPLVTTVSGRTYRDYNSPDSFDLARMKRDLRACIEEGRFDYILVEGLLTLQDDEIFGLLDLRVFVDCPADLRIIRRLRRNMAWGLSFDEIADVYLDLVRHRHEEYVAPSVNRAQLVIDSAYGIETGLQELLKNITEMSNAH